MAYSEIATGFPICEGVTWMCLKPGAPVEIVRVSVSIVDAVSGEDRTGDWRDHDGVCMFLWAAPPGVAEGSYFDDMGVMGDFSDNRQPEKDS